RRHPVLSEPRQQSTPLLGAGLHDRLAVHLLRQRLEELDPVAPTLLWLLLPGLRESKVDVDGDLRRACSRRMIVGRNYQFGELIDDGEFFRREKQRTGKRVRGGIRYRRRSRRPP